MSVAELVTERAAYQKFLDSRKTLVISSTDEQDNPFVSYAPFITHADRLYIYVSRIAEHYWHLANSDTVSVLLIADEADTTNLFARERVRFECGVERLDDAEEHDELFALFRDRFNAKLIDLLQTLDFSLFELSPRAGRYVVGFGKAYDVDLAGTRFDHVVVDKRKSEITEQERRAAQASQTRRPG